MFMIRNYLPKIPHSDVLLFSIAMSFTCYLYNYHPKYLGNIKSMLDYLLDNTIPINKLCLFNESILNDNKNDVYFHNLFYQNEELLNIFKGNF